MPLQGWSFILHDDIVVWAKKQPRAASPRILGGSLFQHTYVNSNFYENLFVFDNMCMAL